MLYLTNCFVENTMLCGFKLECALAVVHSNSTCLFIQSLSDIKKITVSTFFILNVWQALTVPLLIKKLLLLYYLNLYIVSYLLVLQYLIILYIISNFYFKLLLCCYLLSNSLFSVWKLDFYKLCNFEHCILFTSFRC